MNIRQSRLLRLVLGDVLALSALLGAGSAVAEYKGSWTPVAFENQQFSVQAGDFVRYGVTDIPNCSDNACLGLWTYKGFSAAGTASCSNAGWGGDPYPNRVKNCEKLSFYSNGALVPEGHVGTPTALRFVATEGSTNLSSVVSSRGWTCAGGCNVYYIAFPNNGNAQDSPLQPLSGSMTCTNAYLGDPYYGIQKHCFIQKD